ncbi:MAG: exosortase/archaeosortase family protein [Candidatus Hydrothermarchaeota archaeon]
MRFINAVFILALIPLFGSEIFRLLSIWYEDPWSRHGILVPIMSFIIFKERWKIPCENEKFFRVAGLILLVLVSFLRYNLFYLSMEVMILSLMAFIFGYLLLFYPVQKVKKAIPSILFLIFLIPPNYYVITYFGAKLSLLEANLAIDILNGLGTDLSLKDTVILNEGVPMFYITPLCSSGEILIPFFVFTAFIFLLPLQSLKRKTILSLSILLLIPAINVMRLMLILLIALNNMHLAQGVFHIFGGWLMFMILMIVYLRVLAHE